MDVPVSKIIATCQSSHSCHPTTPPPPTSSYPASYMMFPEYGIHVTYLYIKYTDPYLDCVENMYPKLSSEYRHRWSPMHRLSDAIVMR